VQRLHPSFYLSSLIVHLPLPQSTHFPYTTLFRSSGPTSRVERPTTTAGSVISARRLCPAVPTGSPSTPVATSLRRTRRPSTRRRSEEHTSELQSRFDLVCRLLPVKKN